MVRSVSEFTEFTTSARNLHHFGNAFRAAWVLPPDFSGPFFAFNNSTNFTAFGRLSALAENWNGQKSPEMM